VGLGLGVIGFTYHRLLTHRGFTVPKWLEYVGTVCGMLMSEGGAITWVAMHRLHHANSDRPGQDLHTPKDGFWWSHVGWILSRRHHATRTERVKDLARFLQRDFNVSTKSLTVAETYQL
jgi:stearoyl-CoA desaturase (delta-9 desaturase)